MAGFDSSVGSLPFIRLQHLIHPTSQGNSDLPGLTFL